MAERQFVEDRLAALYDLFHPPEQRDDFNFYFELIMGAESVLDVGCGTGALLRRARDAGHTGRLYGLDPAPGMLNQARQRQDIEWVQGDLANVSWERAFDLIVMTGHAFQEFTDDDEIRTALASIHAALSEHGRFVFETRNPLMRAWERWSTDYSGEVVTDAGDLVQRKHELVLPIEGDVVQFTTTYVSPSWDTPVVSHGSLRFLSADSLAAFLSDLDLTIEEQFGDWDRQPLISTSPEIITVARRR